MKYLKVKLWGKEIGRLVWESNTRRTYFVYNPELGNDIPDIAPLLSPKGRTNRLFPVYGDDRPLYQGLPPFIADSLPDSWGNTLFDRWVKENKVPRNKVTPLYKLMFIGTRGMGALEYEPAAEELTHTRGIDINALYDLSLRILEDREDISIKPGDELTQQALLVVGTSAGGRQMKAIIAINRETGEIRSGQGENPESFDYYILKFGDKSMPVSEIEATYFEMARAAGVEMEDSRLFPVEGINHFLTRRFDRKKGSKIHVQTLAAINPDARSYEDLIATCRALSLTETEIEQLYRRMVFNIMANNTDDHNKNFSFMLEEGGRWRLAPAYDVTFIFNTNGTAPNIERRMSIGGLTSEITKEDLLDFARQNDIKNARAIIDSVAASLANFAELADKNGITQPWRSIIQKSLNDTLTAYGYQQKPTETTAPLTDKFGRSVSDINIAVNSKGYYDISAIINGSRRRKFIRQNNPFYTEIATLDIYNLPPQKKLSLIEELLPPE